MTSIALEDVAELRQLAAILRSGKYEQITQKLCHNGRYCCVGVHQHMFGKTDKELEGYGTVHQMEMNELEVHRLPSGILFETVAFKLITPIKRNFCSDVEESKPVTMNDTWHFNFERIADVIDYNCDLAENRNVQNR